MIESTSPIPDHVITVSVSAIHEKTKVTDFEPKRNGFCDARTSKDIQKVDNALPGNTPSRFMTHSTEQQGVILVQVRTNKSRLYTYLSKINIADTDRCRCSFPTLVY